MNDAPKCDVCHKQMILEPTGMVYACYPARHQMMYWCRCGFTSPAPDHVAKTEHDERLKRWEKANDATATDTEGAEG